MMAPTTAATRPATGPPAGPAGASWWRTAAAPSAPTPAKMICDSQSMPPSPVTIGEGQERDGVTEAERGQAQPVRRALEDQRQHRDGEQRNEADAPVPRRRGRRSADARVRGVLRGRPDGLVQRAADAGVLVDRAGRERRRRSATTRMKRERDARDDRRGERAVGRQVLLDHVGDHAHRQRDGHRTRQRAQPGRPRRRRTPPPSASSCRSGSAVGRGDQDPGQAGQRRR